MPTPVTLQQVAEFKCWPKKDDVGGLLILTNQLRVWYYHGYVNGFRTPRSYYNLQDPEEIPRFYGPLKMSQDEALRFARDAIVKLGYSLKETFADQPPEIDLPPKKGTNIVPHYRFQWKDPVFGGTAVSIEVDGGRKMVHELWLTSPFFCRSPPRVSVQAKLRNPRPPVDGNVSNEFLSVTLPKISEFASKLELPVKVPLIQAHVESVEFVHFDSDVRTKLTNGYWFVSRRGAITEFSAPDSVFGRQPPALDPFPRPFEEYLGGWRLSEKEGIDLVRHAIKKLGYTVEGFYADRIPAIIKPEPVGPYVVPRYYFQWLTNDAATGGTIAMIRGEVDGERGHLKHLDLLGEPLKQQGSGAYERPDPKADWTTKRPLFFDSNKVHGWRAEDFDPRQRPITGTNAVIRPGPPDRNPYE